MDTKNDDLTKSFESEVAGRFGLLPNFFRTAEAAPGLIRELWSFAKAAYLDNPLPSAFKERLFVHLSRFCEVRYCVIRHVGFLLGYGNAAGDASAPAHNFSQALALLSRRIPGPAELDAAILRLESNTGGGDAPAQETQLEADLFDALSAVFLNPTGSDRARLAARRCLGGAAFEYTMALLAFVRTAHYWTETHPDLCCEHDMLRLMSEHPELARLLTKDTEAQAAIPKHQNDQALERAVADADDARRSALKLKEDAMLAKEALRQSEDRFRMLADNMSPLAWICDQLGNVTWYNKRWLDYTGMTFEEMAGWDWSKVQHPDYVERVVEGVRRSRDTGEVWEDTFPLRGKDGTYRWFLSRAIPIRDSAGNIVQWFGTNTDVTENRLAEAALIKSEKLAAAGRLAFVLAHEINNPLQAVTNLMALLEKSEELHDSTRTHARMATEELARISRLTRQSLKFYRDSTSPGTVDVREALDGVLDFYARQCENRGITVKRQYRSNVTIQSYAGEIRQVVTTLLVNAMDAMRGAGTIVVHVRKVGSKRNRTGLGVRIAIADTGTGISEGHVSRIFEPFFTTKGQQGTGLGLWVAQGIVSRLGGSIKVRSGVRPQKSGTVFSIFLPGNLPGNK